MWLKQYKPPIWEWFIPPIYGEFWGWFIIVLTTLQPVSPAVTKASPPSSLHRDSTLPGTRRRWRTGALRPR